MKELKLPSEKKKFRAGKKYIAVLAICLVAVAVAGYISIEQSLTYTKPISEPPVSNAEKVDKPQKNVVEPKESGSSSEEPAPEPSAPAEPTLLIWPVNGGTLLRECSTDALVFSPTMQDWRTHCGIDIASPVGSTVRAMAAGEVMDVREDEMLGTVVEIAHGSYTACYCNLQQEVSVKVGDTVGIGDTVGGVGDKARLEIADEPHLHLELRKNGELIDPMSVMNVADVE